MSCGSCWIPAHSFSGPAHPLAFSATARSEIEKPNITALVSAATIWEMAIKFAKTGPEALGLPGSLDTFVNNSLSRFSFAILPVAMEHALGTSLLPLHHRDPFDRMLIAQALAEDIPIATPDPAFAAYGVKLLWQ